MSRNKNQAPINFSESCSCCLLVLASLSLQSVQTLHCKQQKTYHISARTKTTEFQHLMVARRISLALYERSPSKGRQDPNPDRAQGAPSGSGVCQFFCLCPHDFRQLSPIQHTEQKCRFGRKVVIKGNFFNFLIFHVSRSHANPQTLNPQL